jgi:hypothetical protein
VSNLPNGSYTFEALARDAAGNLSAIQSRGFAIDATAPQSTITSGPLDGDPVNSTTVTFGFESSEAGSTFECRVAPSGVTPGDWGPCSDPTSHTASGFSDGSYVFSVRATDPYGNPDPMPPTTTFTVDTVAPTVGVTGPAGETVGPASTLTWAFDAQDAGSGVAAVECSVVALGAARSFGACSAMTSGHSVSGLAGGAHELAVRATDEAGNETVVTRTFIVDDVAPATSVLSGPANGARIRVRSVRYDLGSTEDGSTFDCRLYRAGTSAPPFQNCSAATSHATSGLSDGRYVFQAVATDQVGNVDATPVTRAFTVDTVAPRTWFRSGPPRTVLTTGRTARAAFGLGGERYARFLCKLDARAWRSCTSRPAYVVGLGAHTLRVAAVDRAGNVDRSPAVRRWTVRRR